MNAPSAHYGATRRGHTAYTSLDLGERQPAAGPAPAGPASAHAAVV